MIITLLYLAGFVLVVFLIEIAWERLGRGRPEPIPEAETMEPPPPPNPLELRPKLGPPEPTHRRLRYRSKNDAFDAAAWKAIMEIESRRKGEDRE